MIVICLKQDCEHHSKHSLDIRLQYRNECCLGLLHINENGICTDKEEEKEEPHKDEV